MGCSFCSSPVPDGARFCPSCGHQIASQEVVGDEERRVVTVLFADLVGFTALAEQRDPEQVKRLVEAAFEQLVAEVEAHGGVVDKVLGDAIVALFGAPVAHEDDADRAVRAGLAMQATLRRFRDEHPADAVRMRIGINTGEVLVGTLAGTDYTAMGDVVNTAARLQEVAPAGAVFVGDDTRQLCSPALMFKPVDERRIRGRAQELQVWQAVAIDAMAAARRWDSEVPFVGRVVELGMLGSVAAIARSGRAALVAVAGEAGIGKTRLVHEVVAAFVDDHPSTTVIEGSCAPYGEPNVWWPVAGGVLTRLGLDRDLPTDTARERVRRRLVRTLAPNADDHELDRVAEVVLHLLGHPSRLDDLAPAATRDAVISVMVDGLVSQAEHGPVILWIDDLHWAAPVLLDMLETLVRQLSGTPFMIVATYRPTDDGSEEWPPPVDPALSLHLPLSPLDEHESVELVAQAAGRRLSDEVVSEVSTRSGGNPLFLIELARLASADDSTADLPGSVRALIAARLDLLTPSQRAVLDNAAVLGNEGRTQSLSDFAAELRQDYDPDDLRALESRGLLVRNGANWRFRSDVVREVAYSTLTKVARAQRHAGIASYLTAHKQSSLEPIAHHTASAAELVGELGAIPFVPSDIAERARGYLMEAADRSFRQGANRRGVTLVERGLALSGGTADSKRLLLLMLAAGLVDTHDHQRARAVLSELEASAEEADDRIALGEVHRLRGQIEQMEGDLVAARRELGRAVGEFRELDDEAHLAVALRARGFAEIFGGSLAEAEWFLGEADGLFTKHDNARGHAWVLQNKAWVSFLSGDHAESERRLDEAMVLFDEMGDRAGRNWSLGLLAYVRHFGRRNDEAEQLAATTLEQARRWGDEWGASMMLNLQASIRLWAGSIDQARELAERALKGFRRLDDRFGMIQALGTLNRAYVGLGRFSDADRTVEESLVLSGSFGELAYPALAAAGTAMHRGQGGRAVELATNAIERLDTTGANIDEGRAVAAFGHVLMADPEHALALLLEVSDQDSPFVLAARATAAVMIGDRERALADAQAVASMGAISYWDAAMAAVAGAVAGSGVDLDAVAEQVTDVVLSTYVSAVAAGLARGYRAEGDPAPQGQWNDVADRLVAARG